MSMQSPLSERQASTAAILPIRNAGFDALRAALTLLVVFHHTAITYGASGGWFYREIKPSGALSSLLLVLFCALNQAYFMGLFFLLAGYFTPAAIRAKGAARFLAERLIRLGLPLLVFGLLLGPFTIALARSADGRPLGDSLLALWRRGTFEVGPLWFAEALLIFCAGAVLWYALVQRPLAPIDDGRRARFPSNRFWALWALATGATAFAVRLWWPVGANIWGLQFGYFPGYVVLFAAGLWAADRRWLEHPPEASVRVWRRVALVALPILPVAALLGPIIPALAGKPEGGWTLPALVYAFWEPLVAWGTIMVLVVGFQRRFAVLNPFWQTLSRRAFAIYVIHPPVLVGVALAWRAVPAPALLKFAVTGSIASALCFVLAGWLLRVPGVRRVL